MTVGAWSHLGLMFCCTLKRYICTYSIYIHTYYTLVCSARAIGALSSLLGCVSPGPHPHLGSHSPPCLWSLVSAKHMWNVPEKCPWELPVQLGGPSLDSASWGCFPVGGCPAEDQSALRATASPAPPHTRLGFYLPPHTPVVGGLSGAPPQLLPSLPGP